MFGIDSFWVALGFILTILSTILCIVYGVINWNKEGELKSFEIREEKKWIKEEEKLEEEIL